MSSPGRAFVAGAVVGVIVGMLLAAHADRGLIEEMAASNRRLAELAEAQDNAIRQIEPLLSVVIGRGPWVWARIEDAQAARR